MQALSAPNVWDARDGAVPPSTFRQALGRFGSGVTVVTVAHDTGYHAMTANAFMSISLDPPLVAISVARKARMHEHLQEGGRIGISILEGTVDLLGDRMAGLPGFDHPQWIGPFAPSGVPKGLLQQMAQDVTAVIHNESTVKQFAKMFTVPGTRVLDDFGKVVERDAKWQGDLSQSHGIKMSD